MCEGLLIEIKQISLSIANGLRGAVARGRQSTWPYEVDKGKSSRYQRSRPTYFQQKGLAEFESNPTCSCSCHKAGIINTPDIGAPIVGSLFLVHNVPAAWTPIAEAVISNNVTAVRVLHKCGAAPDVVDRCMRTILHLAAKWGGR
jgi:hypothetical protein